MAERDGAAASDGELFDQPAAGEPLAFNNAMSSGSDYGWSAVSIHDVRHVLCAMKPCKENTILSMPVYSRPLHSSSFRDKRVSATGYKPISRHD